LKLLLSILDVFDHTQCLTYHTKAANREDSVNGWARFHRELNNKVSGVLRGYSAASRITKGEKKPSRQRKKILEYLQACFDAPREQSTDVTKRGAIMHTQYKSLMNTVTAQPEMRRQQQQAEQQKLQEIEGD
jgi:hypothetical protein